jgi:hypothetical protein
MESIYVCPKCELQVKYSKLFCGCGTQLVRTDDASADDVFRKYRESNGIEVTKNTNEEETNTSQNFYDKVYLSQSTEKDSVKSESLKLKKKILIQTIYFISTFWVFAGFTLSYASYISYLTLFLITLIVYIAIYKINLGNYSASIKRTTYWLLFGGVFMLVIVMEINPFIQRSIEFVGNSYKYGSCSVGRFFSSPPKPNLTSVEWTAKELYENAPAKISPVYLRALFRDGTDLQKSNVKKAVEGKVILWKLKVENVSEKYGRINIATARGAVDNRSELNKLTQQLIDGISTSFSGGGIFSEIYENQNIGVDIELNNVSTDINTVNNLKAGDWILVRGKIWKIDGDRVQLDPALLETPSSFALFQSANNKVQQHKFELQKYKEGSCKFKSSGKKSEEPLQQVNSDKSNDVSLVNESNKTLPQITIKQITEYNSYCSKKSINCNWDTLTKQFPLNWEKDKTPGNMDDVYFEAGSRDFKIGTGANKEGFHDNLYISSKYLDGQKKLRKLLESSYSFEKKICSKPSVAEDWRNYIYKTNNKLWFIVYKIENGNEVIQYFDDENPYELIKRNLKDMPNMIEDDCPY